MNPEKLALTIVAPERKLIDQSAIRWAKLPTAEGEIQILPDHADMIGRLETGVVGYETEAGQTFYAAVSTGFFQIDKNHLTLMAETLEFAQEIDANRAAAAQKKAEQILKEAGLEEGKFKKYQLKLERSLIRQNLTK